MIQRFIVSVTKGTSERSNYLLFMSDHMEIEYDADIEWPSFGSSSSQSEDTKSDSTSVLSGESGPLMKKRIEIAIYRPTIENRRLPGVPQEALASFPISCNELGSLVIVLEEYT